MDSIVSELSEIESAATAIVEHAEAQKETLGKEMKARTIQFDMDLDADTKKKVAEISAALEADKSTQLAKLKKENDELLLTFHQEYETQHETYARAIISHIIEV